MSGFNRETTAPGTPATPAWVAPALAAVLDRVAVTHAEVGDRFPLYADPADGRWRSTGRGSWTGGFWAGLLWLRARHTGSSADRVAAVRCTDRLAPWLTADTATRGLIFWYGTAFADADGTAIADTGGTAFAGPDGTAIAGPAGGAARAAALRDRAARACLAAYDADLGLVPWGGAFGGPRLMARIDAVPGLVPLLARADAAAARSHLHRHLELCLGQSQLAWSHLRDATGWVRCEDPPPGWSRGHAWLLLAASEAVRHLGTATVGLSAPGLPEPVGLTAPGVPDLAGLATSGPLVPPADAARPTGPLDTSAAAVTAYALLGLGHRDRALAVLGELVHGHLRDDGRLVNGCYDLAAGTAVRHELIWGDFFLALALARAGGLVGPDEG